MLEVARRAYSLDTDWDAWLSDMAQAALPALDRGAGLIGVAYDARGGGMPKRVGMVATDGAARYLPMLASIAPASDAGSIRDVVMHGGLASVSQILGSRFESMSVIRERSWPVGIRELVQLNACDPSGIGVFVGAPSAEVVAVSTRERATWAPVVAHMAAAMRLRLAHAPSAIEGAEAVLSPEGKLLHAEGEAKDAREQLRRVARAKDAARTSHDDVALDGWTSLIDGRWSLVDHFESDGRRFIVARKNAPDVRDPRALSPRERQVVALAALGRSNKAIAYELGISGARVGGAISAAARKLGASSKSQLVGLLRTMMSVEDGG